MISMIKRPVGRPRKDGSPNSAAQKKPVGRPPNHKPVNRYTGVRAQNINYVREYLRRWLEAEQRGEHLPKIKSGMRDAVGHHRSVLLALRMLLACEEIHLFQTQFIPQSTPKGDELRNRLNQLGAQLRKGNEIKLPALLMELDDLGRESTDD